ncbi:alpha/beta hydrolase (plasmid) [Streptomyces sp. NBC_01450]|uniref:alpha/beta hydrolase n=1 Tax=Streptomyces sp. NBC_01450 TaxID=2903871 RepID=UPI002E340392|nr:alpha/beta hydrolase [Streptomyces sp. NBC_01450]
MASAVLVHGLYHQPEHFIQVAEGLRTAGVDVVTPELHRGSLTADTAAVQAAVDALAEPPLVLGHSYGGSVITGLRGVGRLVYLAAFVPDAHESAASLGGSSPQLQSAIESQSDGSTRLQPSRAVDALYADCPEHLAAWAAGLLRAQGAGCGRGVPERQSWKHIPSAYVVCAEDRAIDPGLQRIMAARCGSVQEWQTGHSPFVGRPELVIDLVQKLLDASNTPDGAIGGITSTR